MAKDYYDDMQDRPSRSMREGSPRPSKGLLLTIVLGIVICVTVIAIWYWSPGQGQQKAAAKQVEAQQLVQVEQIVDAPKVEQVVDETTVAAEVEQVSSRQAVSLSERPAESRVQNSLAVQYYEHTVEEGESLSSIAELYGLKEETLLRVNSIRNIQAITEGVVLRIPDRDGRLYTVQDGDMLSTIARRFTPNLGWKTLQEINNLRSENIVVGQQLFIPDATTSVLKQTVDQAPLQFQKPADGVITHLYGQFYTNPGTGKSESLKGVLIEGRWGGAVTAAASGQVVDAGYEKLGRGRFVVLSHEGGYRTSYHHMENVEVKVGMNLTKGETIGSLGTSGTDWQRPTLFFSIEQSGIALDPQSFF
jgi:lipoprotein NlpD